MNKILCFNIHHAYWWQRGWGNRTLANSSNVGFSILCAPDVIAVSRTPYLWPISTWVWNHIHLPYGYLTNNQLVTLQQLQVCVGDVNLERNTCVNTQKLHYTWIMRLV